MLHTYIEEILSLFIDSISSYPFSPPTLYIPLPSLGHKGRWIGIGAFMMGIGSLICLIPHYMIGPHFVTEKRTDVGQCMYRNATAVCEVTGGGSIFSEYFSKLEMYLNPYFVIFCVGQLLHGFGSTPLFALGTAYIDENVSQKASPVYLGMFMGG